MLDVLKPKNMTKKNRANDKLPNQQWPKQFSGLRPNEQQVTHKPIAAKPNSGIMDAGIPMPSWFSGTRSAFGTKADKQKHTSNTNINGHMYMHKSAASVQFVRGQSLLRGAPDATYNIHSEVTTIIGILMVKGLSIDVSPGKSALMATSRK